MAEKAYTLITGASSGMGEATAKLLCTSRNLILNGRDQARLQAVGDFCSAQGCEVVLFPYDLEEVETLGSALSALLKDNGLSVEAFVHFAGLSDCLPITKNRYSSGLRVMNVNYFSATEMISVLLKKRINGTSLRNIVLTSSCIIHGGDGHQAHYCASKGAVWALGRALAKELAPHVRVNTLIPGGFNTRMMQPLFGPGYDADQWAPQTLLPAGDVIEIAKVTRFLLSEESSYLTGLAIDVDGGQHFPRW